MCLHKHNKHSCLTIRLGQILVKLLSVLVMDDIVHAGVDQLLLLVLQVLGHIVRYKYNAALPVNYKEKAVQGLKEQGQKKGEPNGVKARQCK